MSKIYVEPHNLHEYCEVHEIMKWKDGAIYKTRATGRYVKTQLWQNPDPKRWKLASPSSHMFLSPNTLELEEFR